MVDDADLEPLAPRPIPVPRIIVEPITTERPNECHTEYPVEYNTEYADEHLRIEQPAINVQLDLSCPTRRPPSYLKDYKT